jgi:hypothetical protein
MGTNLNAHGDFGKKLGGFITRKLKNGVPFPYS